MDTERHRWQHRLLIYWLPLALWMAWIFFLSSRPQLPSIPQDWLDTLLKKLGHTSEYAILAVLWWRALGSTRLPGHRMSMAWGLSVLYALSDEYHQTFVPGRNGTFVDLLIDASGALVGLLLFWCWGQRAKRC
ncbi:MAG: VanZ family protein [Chloroflexi bacterium]|nr:VanZ family protein [Chloroflexota bacterium]